MATKERAKDKSEAGAQAKSDGKSDGKPEPEGTLSITDSRCRRTTSG